MLLHPANWRSAVKTQSDVRLLGCDDHDNPGFNADARKYLGEVVDVYRLEGNARVTLLVPRNNPKAWAWALRPIVESAVR